jgi:hypothetical protein
MIDSLPLKEVGTGKAVSGGCRTALIKVENVLRVPISLIDLNHDRM